MEHIIQPTSSNLDYEDVIYNAQQARGYLDEHHTDRLESWEYTMLIGAIDLLIELAEKQHEIAKQLT